MAVAKAMMSSESEDWYTPLPFVEAVRQVLGTINLDPASCEYANRVVQATCYYTKEQNGLMLPWVADRVFLNPPYGKTDTGKSNQKIWTQKLIAEYTSGNIKEAILLVNAATGDEWFEQLKPYWLCLTRRIHFYTESGTPMQPTHGNAFVYFGDNPTRFGEVFHKFGRITPPDPYANEQEFVVTQDLWSLTEDAA